VGVGWEALYRPFNGIVEGEMVKEEERIEWVGPTWTKRPLQPDTGPFHDHLRFDDILNFAWLRCHEFFSIFLTHGSNSAKTQSFCGFHK
jgi:hypothetical protein